jgi:protein ImuA
MGGPSQILQDLRRQIERLEGGFCQRDSLSFGLACLDNHLPGKGLATGALHEIIEGGFAAEFAGSATLFTAGIAARRKGPILWCLARRDLFAPGVQEAGLDPKRVIFAEASHDRDILPLVEEGLHEKGLGAVIGEVTKLSLVASRRLQLAAEASGVPALLIRRWWTVAEKDLTRLPSAAATRWRISPAISEALPVPGLKRPRWLVELVRCKGAEPYSWILEACDEEGHLDLPSDLADRSDPTEMRRTAAQ